MWYFRGVPVVGDRPQSGVRIALERPREGDAPPWRYAGNVALPERAFPVEVVVSAEGDVTVTFGAPEDASGAGAAPPEDLAEKVRLIVRTAFRQAKADGEPPAMRIVRWRGEK